MKSLFLLAILSLAVPHFSVQEAHAYSSNVGADPDNGGEGDLETKTIRKTTVAGESAAISRGHILSFASAADGYTVSRIGGTGASDQNRVTCIAIDDIATGDAAYHRCVTKGYIAFLKYDASQPITAFHNLCVNYEGVATACPAAAAATKNTGVMSLETKASGTGFLKAVIQLR